LQENPTEANRIVKKAVAAAQARIAAKNARNAVRRKTALAGAGMPDKLKDCTSTAASETELYRYQAAHNPAQQHLHGQQAGGITPPCGLCARWESTTSLNNTQDSNNCE
jgi:hypothetical protein